jgi:hypothetical protein
MSVSSQLASRRRVLRGMIGGTAIAVGLPFLDCFLNTNGTALAATGGPLPTAFGTWYWGCGFNPGRWEPKSTGPIKEMMPELKAVEAFRDKINVYSGMKVHLDGRPSQPHVTGMTAVITGVVPRTRDDKSDVPTLDNVVADLIGKSTRFRSLEVAATGVASHSLSRRSATVINPAETLPTKLYARIFGPEFRDPNSAEFSPDPLVMARQSVLSGVTEERRDFERRLGASARARLDEYFTSLRQLEQQLALQLERPAPVEACVVPKGSFEGPVPASEIDAVLANHKLFAKLLAYAVACDQTRVINTVFGDSTSSLRRTGSQMTHHIHTHEEPVDLALGYQPNATWFIDRCMEGLHDYLEAVSTIKEGAGTLLDRMLVFAASDTGYAKSHGMENMPMLTLGGANGRVKTGLHVQAAGDPATRVGLTVQQAMGVSINSWGADSMATSKTISEVLA